MNMRNVGQFLASLGAVMVVSMVLPGFLGFVFGAALFADAPSAVRDIGALIGCVLGFAWGCATFGKGLWKILRE